MQMIFENAEETTNEPEFAAAVIARAARHAHRAESITVFCFPRVPADAPAYKNPGWIEWEIQIVYADGGRLHIGAIQRRRGVDIEFHAA